MRNDLFERLRINLRIKGGAEAPHSKDVVARGLVACLIAETHGPRVLSDSEFVLHFFERDAFCLVIKRADDDKLHHHHH